MNFMQFYGIGEILNHSVYSKESRKTNDYIFCSVEFNKNGKSYYYITEDDSLKIGDYVLVPVRNDSRTAVAEIVNIEYFPEDKVPFPIDKAKSIIGKRTEDELNSLILNFEISGSDEFFCPLYDGKINKYDCDEICLSCARFKNTLNSDQNSDERITQRKAPIVRFIGTSNPFTLINGKLYEVISIEREWYRIVDETDEDYLYPPELFEIVSDGQTES